MFRWDVPPRVEAVLEVQFVVPDTPAKPPTVHPVQRCVLKIPSKSFAVEERSRGRAVPGEQRVAFAHLKIKAR